METRIFDVAPDLLTQTIAQAQAAGWVLVSVAPHDLTTADGQPAVTLYHCVFVK